MTIYRRAGTWVQCALYARIGSGFAKRVVRRRQGGAWVLVTSVVLSGTSTPSSLVVSPGAATVRAGPALSVDGGSGNYSYSTVYLSGSTAPNLENPNSLGVTAAATMSGISNYTTSYRTTVTDNVTGQTAAFDWTVTLSHEV